VLIKHGWSVGSARKLVIACSAAAMTLLIPAAYATSLGWLTACLATATFAYAALSTMILNLPADIYPTEAVASVSGLSGTGAGIGTVVATFLTGIVADRYSFRPVLIVASLVPIAAAVAIFTLVRNTSATKQGLVQAI
jgi:ACS family hexuronate transporter-like MFS transporter